MIHIPVASAIEVTTVRINIANSSVDIVLAPAKSTISNRAPLLMTSLGASDSAKQTRVARTTRAFTKPVLLRE